MPAIITVVLLAACLYVILSKSYDINTNYWAFGVLGTLIGYWFAHEWTDAK